MKKLVIEVEDLKYNINKIKKNTNSKIIAVIKSNGYGLGLIPYSKILIEEEIKTFGVATVEEAISLRQSNQEIEIIMLSSTALEDDVKTLIQNNITLTIGSKEDIKAIENICQDKIKAHIKIDTGFSRYGFRYDKKEEILESIKNFNIQIEGIYSHFSISYYDAKYTKLQYNRFIEVIKYLEENNIELGIKHICNSSAFIQYPEMHLDAVRIGSAFLGRLAIENKLSLKKIGKMETNITEIKQIPKGEYIGYSNSFKTKKDTKVAIIPVGYIDGFNIQTGVDMFRKRDKLRAISSSIKNIFKKQKLYAKIRGENVEILGKVGTHHIVLDITDINCKINEIVELNINPKYVDSSIRREYLSE